MCMEIWGFWEIEKLTSKVKLWHFLAPTWRYVYWRNAMISKNLSHFLVFPLLLQKFQNWPCAVPRSKPRPLYQPAPAGTGTAHAQFWNFVKSMPPSLSELKVTPSFCFAFKIPDDVAASNLNYYLSYDVCAFPCVCPKKNFLMVANIKKC